VQIEEEEEEELNSGTFCEISACQSGVIEYVNITKYRIMCTGKELMKVSKEVLMGFA
jgi:hypothetical protein